ncbi:MAG TPA: VCBS repeat-containing protein, partial [Chthonomonadaceae bacterium]|nr:VCBS repeat-containing protein [Chthonomonadaceae bacterium]
MRRRAARALPVLLALLLPEVTGCARSASSSSPPRADPVPSPSAPLFRDVAHSAGLDFRWGPRDPAGLTIRDMMGFGCAFLDYDGDGKLDILLVAKDHVELYRNRGDGTFENVTARAFPNVPRKRYLMGCSVCDYDGDGRPDIFVTGYGRTILYHNEGNGTFKDVTKGSGLEARGPYDWTTGAAWADLDGDGRPDLYVCRYVLFTPSTRPFCHFKALDGSDLVMTCGPAEYKPEIGSLYRNEGQGRFRDITREAGLADAHGKGLGCRFCDFNGDGRPDLFIANDQVAQDLYLNLGGGRFRNIAAEAGVAFGSDGGPLAGMGVDWGDYDNDGKFDLLVASFSGLPKALFHNESGTLFVDESATAGIRAPSLTSLTFGADFVDVENEGLLDIVLFNGHVQALIEKADATTAYYQSALLFHNQGDGRFRDISAAAGPDFTQKIVGRGVAVGDYDNDGREDLLVVNAE